MVTLDDFGVPVILGSLHRSKDWTEPPAEGEHVLMCQPAGDDDDPRIQRSTN
jgi:hypothetical protein